MKAPSEKHLEDWIVNNFQCLGDVLDVEEYPPYPCEPDAWISETEYIFPYFDRLLKRQPRFPFGRADLIVKGWSNISAVELKAGTIDGETVSQVQRYMSALTYIYKSVVEVARHDTPDFKPHFPYLETLLLDMGLNAVGGMVLGHSLKDKNLLPLCSALGIEVVLYEYDPATNVYRFHQEGGAWVAGSKMVETADDYARGILGTAFREIIEMTIKDAKRQKGLTS